MISEQASANTTKTCLGAAVVCKVKMDQKWIHILVILVFYQSKFNPNFTDKSIHYHVAALNCSPACLLVFCLWVVNDITAPILLHLLEMTSGAGKDMLVKEGERVEIKCQPSELGTMIIWFRVLDKPRMEFIASFSNNGLKKPNTDKPSSAFSDTKIGQNTLILESFSKASDSGLYICASLKGSELKFGEVTRLVGGEFCFTNLVQ